MSHYTEYYKGHGNSSISQPTAAAAIPNYNNNSDLVFSLLQAAVQSYKYASAEASYPAANFPVKLGKDENGDLWVRSFLLNSNQNAANWSVARETLRDNITSAIGKPLVLHRHEITGKIVHPDWRSNVSAQANYASQRDKAIGVIEKVFYYDKNDSYYADIKVTDPEARDYIDAHSTQGSNIHGISVSPQIIYDPKREKSNGPYKNWSVSHLAIVEKGAYGPQAKVIGACNGNGPTCHEKL